MDWTAIRNEFPALQQWTYLNSATFGQVPLRSQAALARHFERRDALACQDFLTWFDDADRLRALIAQFIHCEPADIAFMPTACSVLSPMNSQNGGNRIPGRTHKTAPLAANSYRATRRLFNAEDPIEPV